MALGDVVHILFEGIPCQLGIQRGGKTRNHKENENIPYKPACVAHCGTSCLRT
jgi:hypothetical protein